MLVVKILIQNRNKRYINISHVKRLYPSILVENTHCMNAFLLQEYDKVVAYRLRTISTGQKDTSFLATQTLKKNLVKIAVNSTELQKICEKLSYSLYIDDLTLNEDSEEVAFIIYNNGRKVFEAGGSELIKCARNSLALIEHVVKQYLA